MSAPALSVVVPTRDTRALTLACLAALRRAVPAATEVLVVDDGSRDGTADAVQGAWPAVRVLVHAVPRGFTAAATTGLAAARGTLLLLLNSDTEVAPDAVVLLADAFAADARLGAAGAALVGTDGAPQWSGGPEPTPTWLFALASGAAAPVAWASGAALMLRAAALREVGPLDARFALYAQDADLCLRLRDAGWRVAVIAGARVVHRGGATIDALPGARAGVHLTRLWTDLVALVAKRRGAAAAARAVRALVAGATLRYAALRLAAVMGAPARRADRRRAAAVVAAARAALVSEGRGG